MPKVKFQSILEWFTGKRGKIVFRRSHNGQISIYPSPDMSRVKWSKAQKDHRRQMGEASKYASAAIADPDLRAVYVQMARERDMNPDRPFDTAVKDYYHTGNDLLWKKYMGDQEKPADWKIHHYPWYLTKRDRSKKRRTE